MTNAAKTYTQLAVEGTSPVGLVVALYDNVMKSLYQARRAVLANDIERRTQHLNHALSVVAHLEGTLDMEQGGEVAMTLSHFYTYARHKILEVSLSNSAQKLEELLFDFSSLRGAWQVVDKQVSEETQSRAGQS